MDAIQKRIDILKATTKILTVIVEFVQGYFPSELDFDKDGSGIDFSWKFYNKACEIF